MSRFLEYLCSFFGYSSVVRVSIINNFSLSAFFIARYIMNAIKNGFNYLDIVNPIRKTLNRFMRLKIFDNFVYRNVPFRRDFTRAAVNSSKKRVSLLFFFLFITKFNLFVNDLNIYSNAFLKDLYIKKFCFDNIINNF